jgi:hypothetical protein
MPSPSLIAASVSSILLIIPNQKKAPAKLSHLFFFFPFPVLGLGPQFLFLSASLLSFKISLGVFFFLGGIGFLFSSRARITEQRNQKSD